MSWDIYLPSPGSRGVRAAIRRYGVPRHLVPVLAEHMPVIGKGLMLGCRCLWLKPAWVCVPGCGAAEGVGRRGDEVC